MRDEHNFDNGTERDNTISNLVHFLFLFYRMIAVDYLKMLEECKEIRERERER